MKDTQKYIDVVNLVKQKMIDPGMPAGYSIELQFKDVSKTGIFSFDAVVYCDVDTISDREYNMAYPINGIQRLVNNVLKYASIRLLIRITEDSPQFIKFP